MSDSDNNIDEQPRNEVEMVEMKVSGLGNLSQNEQSLVILLAPSDESYNHQYNEGKQMVFPIAVPKVFSPLYFYRITCVYKLRPVQDDLIDYYSRVTNSRLTHVSIIDVNNQLRGIVHYRRENGMPGHFEANLPNLIYTAIKHGLSIFIEKQLLLDAAKAVKVSYSEEPVNDSEPRATAFELISNYILDGILPDEIGNEELEKNRSSLADSEKKELFDMAIQHEGYEWADWIGRKEEDNDE